MDRLRQRTFTALLPCIYAYGRRLVQKATRERQDNKKALQDSCQAMASLYLRGMDSRQSGTASPFWPGIDHRLARTRYLGLESRAVSQRITILALNRRQSRTELSFCRAAGANFERPLHIFWPPGDSMRDRRQFQARITAKKVGAGRRIILVKVAQSKAARLLVRVAQCWPGGPESSVGSHDF